MRKYGYKICLLLILDNRGAPKDDMVNALEVKPTPSGPGCIEDTLSLVNYLSKVLISIFLCFPLNSDSQGGQKTVTSEHF